MHDTLLQKFPGVWRADSSVPPRTFVTSGTAALDAVLGGGWPQPGLLEFLSDQPGIGELQLLLPLLRLRDHDGDRAPAQVLWLNPPFVPHGVAWAQCGVDPARQWLAANLSARDALWTMEQALRSGVCAVVIAWLEKPALSSLRRLKLASLSGESCGVLFRPSCAASESSPANVRAALVACGTRLQVRLLKAQGRMPATVLLDLQARAEVGRDAQVAGP